MFLYFTLKAFGCFTQNHRMIEVERDPDDFEGKKRMFNIILIVDIRFQFHLQSRNKALDALFFHGLKFITNTHIHCLLCACCTLEAKPYRTKSAFVKYQKHPVIYNTMQNSTASHLTSTRYKTLTYLNILSQNKYV